MPTQRQRQPSVSQHHSTNHNNASSSSSHAPTVPTRHTPHTPTRTAPKLPALLRLPSSTSSQGALPSPSQSRRSSNPTTPTLTTPTTHISTSSATSPSYFSLQPAASGKDARSPAARKPPASNSGHGIDTSKGPPITLITRGNVDLGRQSQNPSDVAFAQQQLAQLGLTASQSSGSRRRRNSATSGHSSAHSTLLRQNSGGALRAEEHMAPSLDDSSEYDSERRSQSGDTYAAHNGNGATYTSGTDGEQGEDLFIAAAVSPRGKTVDAPSRADRLRSRIAVRNNRQSFPLGAPSTSSLPYGSRLPSAINTEPSAQPRRASQLTLTPRLLREQSPLSPSLHLESPRTRLQSYSPKPLPLPSKSRDQDLSPQQFLSQISDRRPSYADAAHTPPNRSQVHRPSNLHYSATRERETPQESASSRADETESLDSTGPAASVWDELDDLKSRIRRIEMGSKIPTTSGAVVAQASADRPRTANTSATTVSSSPKQQRKTTESPSEATTAAQSSHTPHKVHPLLKDALVKAKQHVAPSVYRVLEATASEAIGLAELTGSVGPQGTFHSTSSNINGAQIPDRQVRRKADNICRALTELCIELCDSKSIMASPALRTMASTARQPSVQVNGDSPQIRQSIEPESDTLLRSSPSRALTRIEARRSSLMTSSVNGNAREGSQEPSTPSQSLIPSRLQRAGTSLQRTRHTEEDDEDLTLRAPSRAFTDFRESRPSNHTKRSSKEYTSQEPMPESQPSSSVNTTFLRRPTVSGAENNHVFFRDGGRRYLVDRQSSPAYEKQVSADLGSRLAQPTSQYISNRASIGASIARLGSVNRRLRGASVGE